MRKTLIVTIVAKRATLHAIAHGEKKPRPTPSIPIDSQGNKDSNTQNRKDKKKAEPKKYKDRGKTALAYLIHDIASDDEDETSLSDTTSEGG